jgi:replicative DNA helicase
MKYYKDSSTSLLTRETLADRLIRNRVTDIHKAQFVLLWEKVQEQDYDENDTYNLLERLKQEHTLKMFNDMYKDGYDELTQNGLDSAVESIEEYVAKINDERNFHATHLQSIDAGDCADYFQSEYTKRLEDPEQYRGIYCGLPAIDNRTFGFQPGQLITLLAISSGGKSVQLLNWAMNAYKEQKKNVLYFSFEMDLWLCLLRHMSLEFDIPYDQLKSGNVPSDVFSDMVNQMRAKENGYFEYEVSLDDPTPEFVDSRIRELARKKGKPDLVVVDYIGNMRTRKSDSKNPTWQQQGDAAVGLFALAKHHNIPIITAQQINRASITENRRNNEANKASRFFQDAAAGDQRLMYSSYYVIGMETDKDNNLVTYHPVKMRDAQFESFQARFDRSCNRITEIEQDENVELITVEANSTDTPVNELKFVDYVAEDLDEKFISGWDV